MGIIRSCGTGTRARGALRLAVRGMVGQSAARASACRRALPAHVGLGMPLMEDDRARREATARVEHPINESRALGPRVTLPLSLSQNRMELCLLILSVGCGLRIVGWAARPRRSGDGVGRRSSLSMEPS
jgi:hypothetical protein